MEDADFDDNFNDDDRDDHNNVDDIDDDDNEDNDDEKDVCKIHAPSLNHWYISWEGNW